MKRLMLLTAAFALTATMAMALTATDLVAAYQAQGFTKIEVTTGLTQIKVDAVKGNSQVEAIYDSATGAILKQDSGFAPRRDRGTGVQLRTSTHDFLGGDGNGDGNGGGGGNGDGNNDGQHDQNDDHGSGDGANHDAGDDHGGDHENGDRGHDGGKD